MSAKGGSTDRALPTSRLCGYLYSTVSVMFSARGGRRREGRELIDLYRIR